MGPLPRSAMSHLRTPHGAGGLAEPSVLGQAGGGACGDELRVELRIDGDIVRAAGFRALGCPAMTAAASAACAAVEGSDVRTAMGVSVEAVDAALGGLGRSRGHGAEVAIEALAAALEVWVSERLGEEWRARSSQRVAVAMSGGVDSAVAALLLADAGYQVVGVTMRLWHDPGAAAAERSCCAPETVRLARASAHAIGIPHVTIDAAERFRRGVVEDFVAGYAAGRTPNPCVTCNGRVRFRLLADAAAVLGAELLASGHYATAEGEGHERRIGRAADRAKDQSYMLAGVPQELISRLRFPLGALRKGEVRRIAREAGLPAASAVESQEICFVGDAGYAEFLERHAGLGERPGSIVDLAGTRVGEHGGYWRYTVGQRKGLGLSGPEPRYVLSTDVGSNTVVVGRAEDLDARVLHVIDASVRDDLAGGGLKVRIRHRGPTVPARTITEPGRGSLRIELDESVRGVAPGQTAAVYRDDRIVAAGTIAGSSS